MLAQDTCEPAHFIPMKENTVSSDTNCSGSPNVSKECENHLCATQVNRLDGELKKAASWFLFPRKNWKKTARDVLTPCLQRVLLSALLIP